MTYSQQFIVRFSIKAALKYTNLLSAILPRSAPVGATFHKKTIALSHFAFLSGKIYFYSVIRKCQRDTFISGWVLKRRSIASSADIVFPLPVGAPNKTLLSVWYKTWKVCPIPKKALTHWNVMDIVREKDEEKNHNKGVKSLKPVFVSD